MPPSPRSRITLLSLFAVATSFLADPMSSGAGAAPPAIVERGRDAEWVASYAWRGGVQHVFGEPEKGAAGELLLPGGATFEFVFGCREDAMSGKGYWRFRVGATRAGSGITAAGGKADDEAVKRIFGSPGSLVLLDAGGRETHRLALQPTDDGLETVALWDEVMQAMLNASAIRAESAGFLLETGASGLKSALKAHREIRCKPW